jgi:hypothetical protein
MCACRSKLPAWESADLFVHPHFYMLLYPYSHPAPSVWSSRKSINKVHILFYPYSWPADLSTYMVYTLGGSNAALFTRPKCYSFHSVQMLLHLYDPHAASSNRYRCYSVRKIRTIHTVQMLLRPLIHTLLYSIRDTCCSAASSIHMVHKLPVPYGPHVALSICSTCCSTAPPPRLTLPHPVPSPVPRGPLSLAVNGACNTNV